MLPDILNRVRNLLLLLLLCLHFPNGAFASNISKQGWIGKTDPSSYSNPEDFVSTQLHLKWEVDFDKKTIAGSLSYEFDVLNKTATQLILDSRDIHIERILSNGNPLPYSFGEEHKIFGSPLKIDVADLSKNGGKLKIDIDYKTDPKCTSLAWMEPYQTSGKTKPFLFSQNQPIHGRSLYPCQDTPSVKTAFTAEITVPKDLLALASAVPTKEAPQENGDKRVYKFSQKIPIPSYLMCIAVGDLKSKQIGPRSTVYAEQEILELAANDFSDVEEFIVAAEKLFGKYEWEVYNLLFLPRAYPVSGMEHPCISFFSQELITGDKGGIDVLAHELSHSWFGNLVTNRNWQEFWMNEGFTVFAERKILGAIKGEEYRQFVSIFGWTRLTFDADNLKDEPDIARLVVEKVADPDLFLNTIPYEKGYAFLYYLEKTVGGPSKYEPFLREYVKKYRHKSIESNQFKEDVISYFPQEKLKGIDWDTWFHGPGLPPFKNNYSNVLFKPCLKLAKEWQEWNINGRAESPFSKNDLDKFLNVQVRQFVQELVDGEDLGWEKVKQIEQIYGMHNRTRNNADIKMRWFQLCAKAKWHEALPFMFEYVNQEGRFGGLKRVYKELYKWEEVRDKAIQNWEENKKFKMTVTVKSISKLLHIDT
ncbi:unnamed protein product [Orchesella dallaii]|uniref:Peptidase M1 leukotriene A4 hydrolase/aminopeptidase C-terminal domain-containing protein n=1 Tax=Orchesella dallaii TaxID=48710 RepID=A0ABP1RUV2_9HEXA